MCVHDYDGNGQHTGYLHAAQFEANDEELHLECVDREIACHKVDAKTICIGEQVFPILGYSTYVGNMMWDMAWVTTETANAIAAVLLKDGNYEPDYGTLATWERWDGGEPLFSDAD
jgi:hypothetical protein